ncbi:hypothetical protein AGMMS50229_18220 [Campylobacterota bacterium]|nr:hypothetical protein AGMMS50229_18220 [Campylobacterota bacterium]
MWESSDPSIVSIEADSTITAKALGEVNITAVSMAKTSINATVAVSVDREAAQIAFSGDHTVILDTRADLWVSGRNDYGQLGLGDTAESVWEVCSLQATTLLAD